MGLTTRQLPISCLAGNYTRVAVIVSVAKDLRLFFVMSGLPVTRSRCAPDAVSLMECPDARDRANATKRSDGVIDWTAALFYRRAFAAEQIVWTDSNRQTCNAVHV